MARLSIAGDRQCIGSIAIEPQEIHVPAHATARLSVDTASDRRVRLERSTDSDRIGKQKRIRIQSHF